MALMLELNFISFVYWLEHEYCLNINIKEQNKVQWVILPTELALLAFSDITLNFTLPDGHSCALIFFFLIFFSLCYYHILSHSILI